MRDLESSPSSSLIHRYNKWQRSHKFRLARQEEQYGGKCLMTVLCLLKHVTVFFDDCHIVNTPIRANVKFQRTLLTFVLERDVYRSL